MFEQRLIEILNHKQVSSKLIDDIINSGYIIRDYITDFKGGTIQKISDKLYGNKRTSSYFDIDEFISHVEGKGSYRPFNFNTYTVKSVNEINEVLNDTRRKYHIETGKMSFRGQSREHYIERKIPNPILGNALGKEISVAPGIYRNKPLGILERGYFHADRTLINYLRILEPNSINPYLDSYDSFDMARVEQHYINQTEGLDITFDINSAIFFATHKYERTSNGQVLSKVPKGSHIGVIYCLVFTDPPVKKTEFYIDQFDFFKTYTPERIKRQKCGLPIFNEYERNIAVTDIDCIIYLHPDFEDKEGLSYDYMFPSTDEDKFYEKLLELKRQFPTELSNIVEYIH